VRSTHCRQGKVLAANRIGHAESGANLAPTFHGDFQAVAQLLAALGEAAPDGGVEEPVIKNREIVRGPGREADHGGLDLGPRVKVIEGRRA